MAPDVDFVPLLQERYDLIIPRDFSDSPLLAPLLEIIRSDAFRAAVESMGGYETSETGRIAAEV